MIGEAAEEETEGEASGRFARFSGEGEGWCDVAGAKDDSMNLSNTPLRDFVARAKAQQSMARGGGNDAEVGGPESADGSLFFGEGAHAG